MVKNDGFCPNAVALCTNVGLSTKFPARLGPPTASSRMFQYTHPAARFFNCHIISWLVEYPYPHSPCRGPTHDVDNEYLRERKAEREREREREREYGVNMCQCRDVCTFPATIGSYTSC